ncbi:SAM-dependent methyltransferase [Paenibacillus sp. FSL R7-0273]|uniref:hypothetical protein n=1 Tax=Paenibacillus sp. FSL R7-0273 TaxID=1536772 RepID=UPI0004F7DCFF|nr:hypothetical protein [Paenibacillus sp. FSL R7-0273]AIQ48492.1 SAM-dependent methyltransferase [Paenibacillus sp. FSL R7-0273]OMF86294.1 SAM-dependent methyltransferase [Paenibacillus sp. FSL R7-0273]
MRKFTNETAKKIMANETPVEAMLKQYPEYKDEVLRELGEIKKNTGSNVVQAIIDRYTASAKIANTKISKSGMNEATVNAFLPNIIKARFAIYLLEQLNIAVSAKTPDSNVRFNRWDGMLLQKLLFRKGFERKPVSLPLFRFFWRFIKDKKILMPLVGKKGIYCFYSKALIKELSALAQDRKCLEIAAGDGTLTRFLNEAGTTCTATDDYSWKHYIDYPAFVEKADAKTALVKYSPEVVLCSWPVPKNPYEKHVFRTDSVQLYIVIGTRNPLKTGDFDAYHDAGQFTMELSERLSALLVPPSEDKAVYLFRRKTAAQQ